MQQALFEDIRRTEFIQRLLDHCHRRRFLPKATIIRQGEAGEELFYLISGSVTVLIEDQRGHEIVMDYLYPGEFFGEVGLFNEEAGRTAVVRARSRCEVAYISYAKLRALPDIFPPLLMAISAKLAERLRATNQKLGGLVFLDVSGRVARALMDLCNEPEAMTHSEGMQVRVTRQELSRIAGCSREMVGRILKDMAANALITARGKTIVVKGARPPFLPIR